ncbi:MAG: HAMP domain-containing sensor histidine kinase [Coriobacteriia bacterium]|nr:HAMP domain-containing sensor histidine kinase [Coriobacteriia bacterium]
MAKPEHENDSDRIRRLERELIEVTGSRERLLAEVNEYRDNMARIIDANSEQLLRTNARLIEAMRMRDRFLANMSHELRGPLNPILGFAGIMLSGAAGPINEEQRRQLEMVRIAGAQLLTIVDDVLAFAETLTDTNGHRIIEADVCDIVRALARGRERTIWERGVRLCLEMPSYACVVPTDPDIVSRAIDALLSNAVKYSSP